MSKASQLKCANCGKPLASDELRNVDGEPCCKTCWDMEEERLARER